MKKFLRLLLVFIIILSCFLALASCDETTDDQGANITQDGENDGNNSNDEMPHTHSFGEWEITKKASCTENGEKTRYCACGEKQTDVVATVDHTEIIDPAVESTCSNEGLTEGKHCGICNTVIIPQTPTVKKSHVWDDGEVTVQPGTNTSGERTFRCDVCKGTMTEEIPPLKHVHVYKGIVVDPTCEEKGYTAFRCACGDIYKDNYVDENGHTEVIDHISAF